MTGAEALQNIIEMIETLTLTVNELKISVQLIESNIKTLNNRAAGLILNTQSLTTQVQTDNYTSNISAILPQAPTNLSRGRQLSETEQSPISQTLEGPGVLTYKKVFGKLINDSSSAIENVLIKVYDKNNEVCATAETDPIGYFEFMLKPGRYVAEYLKTGFKTINKTFDVSQAAKEVEIK